MILRWDVTPTGSGSFIYEAGFSGPVNINDGDTVTITKSGGGFGTKPGGAKPVWYYEFETDINPHPTLSRKTTNPGPPFWGSLSSASPYPGDTNSLRHDLSLTEGDQDTIGFGWTSDASNNADFTTFYLWATLRDEFTFNGTGLNWKPARIWGNRGGSGTTSFAFGMNGATDPPNGAPVYVTETGDPFRADNQGPSHEVWKSWTVHEWVHKQSSISVVDGITHHRLNARYAHTGAGFGGVPSAVRWSHRGAGGTAIAQSDEIFLTHFEAGTQAPLFVNLGRLYIDDSWSHAFVSDETSYQEDVAHDAGLPKRREVCVTTAWADGSVSFLLRQGGHASLVGKYLYIETNTGTVFKVGRWT